MAYGFRSSWKKTSKDSPRGSIRILDRSKSLSLNALPSLDTDLTSELNLSPRVRALAPNAQVQELSREGRLDSYQSDGEVKGRPRRRTKAIEGQNLKKPLQRGSRKSDLLPKREGSFGTDIDNIDNDESETRALLSPSLFQSLPEDLALYCLELALAYEPDQFPAYQRVCSYFHRLLNLKVKVAVCLFADDLQKIVEAFPNLQVLKIHLHLEKMAEVLPSLTLPLHLKLHLRLEHGVQSADDRACLRKVSYNPNVAGLSLKGNGVGVPEMKTLLSNFGARGGGIEWLDLDKNNLGVDCGEALDGQTRELRYLSMNSNELTSCGVELLGSRLQEARLLASLKCGENSLGDDGVTLFSKYLRKLPLLRHLHLRENLVTAGGCYNLCLALRELPLLTLNLESNNIGDSGLLHICCYNLHSLTDLNVAANNISATGTKHLAAQAKKHPIVLKALNLDGNRIQTEGLEFLADSFERNGTLTDLGLASNGIDSEGMVGVARLMRRCHQLQTLSLEWNRMKSNGAKLLGDVLHTAENLTKLDVSANQIGSSGASSLAKAATEHPCLRAFNIGFNDIGTDGTRSIAVYLRLAASRSITDVNVEGNEIGAGGARALAEAIRENHSITNLNLGYNDIGAGGRDAILDGLQYNRGLRNGSVFATTRKFVGSSPISTPNKNPSTFPRARRMTYY